MIIAANQPEDITTYICSKNEVKLLSCVYDLESGDFKGVREQIAFIVLRGDVDETFLSYGFNKIKSKVLYSFLKQQIPNAFVSVAFKKHFDEIMNENKVKLNLHYFTFFHQYLIEKKQLINLKITYRFLHLMLLQSLLRAFHQKVGFLD